MDTHQAGGRKHRKRGRKARKAFVGFLKRLRRACAAFETANEWYQFLQQLEPLLQEYQGELTGAQLERLRHASRLVDSSREGIGQACNVLQLEVAQAIKALPGPLVAPMLVSLLVTGAWLVGGVVVYLHLTSGQVELTIRNDGCAPIPLRQGMAPGEEVLIDLIGIDLPQQIPTDLHATGRAPLLPLTIGIDATAGRAVELTVQGTALTLSILHGADAVALDGVSILVQHAVLNLGHPGHHEFVVTCR